MKHLYCLLLGAILLVAAAPAQTLAPGDIALIGINSDDPDEFAFVPFVDLPTGTVISFTDQGWLAAGGFRTGEGTLTWTASDLVVAGTVVNPGVGTMLFSTSGDQIIAYQGDASTPTPIYALNDEGAAVWQTDATSTNTSALPTGLVNGETAVALNELDNVVYVGITTGTRADLLAAIGNPANWSGSDATRQTMPPGPFTITDGGGGSGAITLALNSTSATLSEEAGTLSIPIILTTDDGMPSDAAVTATIALTSGDAADFSGTTSIDVTFPADTASGTTLDATFSIFDDDLPETTEVFGFTLSSLDADNVGVSAFTLTLLDNEPSVNFASSTATANEGDGTATLTVDISNTPGSTVEATVALVGGTGNPGDIGSFSSQTVMFPAGDASPQTVTLFLTDDAVLTGSRTFVFALQNVSANALIANPDSLTFTLTDNEPPVNRFPGLLISEVVDGTNTGGTPKYVEVYNAHPTDTYTLGDLQIRRYANGGTTPGSVPLNAVSLAPGDVYVVADDDFDPAWGGAFATEVPDQTSGTISGNGDDVYELYDAIVDFVLDRYGELGIDGSGTAWEYTDSQVIRYGNTPNEGAFDVSAFQIVPYTNENATPGTHTVIFPQTTSVAFNPTSATANEGDGAVNLSVVLTTSDGLPSTEEVTATVSLTTGDAADFSGATADTLVFAAGTASGTTLNATFALNDDTAIEASEDFTFTLASDADSLGASTFTLTITDNDTPVITVMVPNGGESWSLGSTQTITWTDNITENVTIRLLKGTAVVATIANNTPSDGSFDWTIPTTLTAGSDYKVRIQSVTTSTLRDDSDNFFTLTGAAASITVTVPNGGESWSLGSTQTITWTDNITENVTIRLLKGTAVVATIVSNTPSDGSHSWTIPTTLTAGSDYKVRIQSVTTSTLRDDSDNFFTLTGAAASITVTVPNGGESWVLGSTQTITWTDNITENVNIRLLKGTATVATIASNTPSDGSFDWTIPTTLTAGSDYKVRIQSVTTSTLRDDSDNFFSLVTALAKGETQAEAVLPTAYALLPNYPNPFNPSTTVTFALPETAKVRLVVYDLLGRAVRILAEGTYGAGTYPVVFDASTLPSGLYLLQLTTPQQTFTRTLSLMK
jgi:hypothetical protein